MEKLAQMAAGPVYLYEEVEEQVFRTEPGKTWDEIKFFAKNPGGKEFPAIKSSKGVTNAVLQWEEITQEQYKSF